MKEVKRSVDYILYIMTEDEHEMGLIWDIQKKRYSSLFTLEVVDNLGSMDEAIYNYECSQLMNVEDFHVEREWSNAD